MRKAFFVAFVLLLLFGAFASAFKTQQTEFVAASDSLIIVPWQFATIQEAVNNASEGDIIEVVPRDASYYENVTVNKTLTIRRWSEASPTQYPSVDGGNREGIVFNVTAPAVEISGLEICNGSQGIRLEYPSHSNNIHDNRVTSNRIGIVIDRSPNNTLSGNNIFGNTQNFGVNPTNLPVNYLIQNIDTSNTVDGRPIYYLVNQNGLRVPANAGYVAIVNSTDVTVEDVSLSSNIQGVLAAYSSRITVEDLELLDPLITLGYAIEFFNVNNSTIQNNVVSSKGVDIAIEFAWSDNNIIANNTVAIQTDWMMDVMGMEIGHSLNNTVVANTINGTVVGIAITYSNDTILFHNNFLENINQLVTATVANTTLDNGAEGNYWMGYTGEDSDGDGIGDNSYAVGGLVDRFPLIEEWRSTRLINVTWLAKKLYYITITSEHVVASYTFKPYWEPENMGIVTFNITSNSSGTCNVTIPLYRLDAPFELFIDDEQKPFDYDSVPGAENISLSFNFTEGTHRVRIVGYKLGIAYEDGDLNGDGRIDMRDIGIIARNFGKRIP